jgi:hypothetical protein
VKRTSVSPWEGQSVADAIEQIREQVAEYLTELDNHDQAQLDITARYRVVLEYLDALQLLLFREDPPAFLTKRVK